MSDVQAFIRLEQPDDPFLVKANAALWKWEQVKTASSDNSPSLNTCDQRPKPQGKQ